MKVFSDGSAIWKKCTMTGLLRVYVGEHTGIHSVGKPRKMWIGTMKKYLKKRDWMSGKQGEWCMIGMNGRDL